MDPDENVYRWQGCSDNIEYGVSASREWADAGWKSKIRLSRDLDLGPGGEFILDDEELELFVNEQNLITTTPARSGVSINNHNNNQVIDGKKIIMNQQNNNVGRQVGKIYKFWIFGYHVTPKNPVRFNVLLPDPRIFR